MTMSSTRKLALFGTLLATFGEIHPLCDQWCQSSHDSIHKGDYGDHLVYVDGTPVGEETDDRTGQPTTTATTLGRQCATRHVATYTAVQLATTVAVTRSLGYRVPAGALLAGALINGTTHLVIDRREPLKWLAGKVGKGGYIDYCTVVRKPGGEAEETGPGTGLMELDQALHRAIGISAALVTTWLATRKARHS